MTFNEKQIRFNPKKYAAETRIRLRETSDQELVDLYNREQALGNVWVAARGIFLRCLAEEFTARTTIDASRVVDATAMSMASPVDLIDGVLIPQRSPSNKRSGRVIFCD